MTSTDVSECSIPAFWLRQALLVPLAVGGLCVAVFAVAFDVFLVMSIDPLLPNDVIPEERELFATLIKLPIILSVLVIAMLTPRAFIQRDGAEAAVLTERHLLGALMRDHVLFVWFPVVVFVSMGLGLEAVAVFFGVRGDYSSALILCLFSSGLALRLTGFCIWRWRPDLWAEIEARAKLGAKGPSPGMWALIAGALFLSAAIVLLPSLLRIYVF